MNDVDQLIVVTTWDEAEGMYHANIKNTKTVFKSRYALWAKAHALQWYANELYRIKVLTTPVD